MVDFKVQVIALLATASCLWVAYLFAALQEFIEDLEKELKTSFSTEELYWITSNFKWFFLTIFVGLTGLVVIAVHAIRQQES